ncbi:MAG: hypothetical protein ABSF83_10380 [Nitrososphaerales archaeon]|jgi:hypothetical protein
MPEDHYELAAPILPGKLEKWKSMLGEINGPRKKDYQASRKKIWIRHERVWFQHTPQGDFALLSFEGKDTSKALEKLMNSRDPFDKWFAENLKDIHGIEVATSPVPISQLYLDIL